MMDPLNASDKTMMERWPCFGFPSMIVVDNGLDLTSKAVSDACMRGGIEIMYSPPREPWYKGTIERFGGTINVRFIHWLPGTTLGKQLDSYDYNAKKDAAILFDDFVRLIEFYITEVHNHSPRRNKPGTPLERWQNGIAEFPPRVPESIEEFDAAIALTAEATLSHEGVIFKYRKYNNLELGNLWNRLGDKKKVTLKINPLNLERIYVVDPFNDLPISVNCTTPFEYPAVLDYHNAVLEYTKKRGKDPENAAHLTWASQELQRGIIEAAANGKKALQRKRVEYQRLASGNVNHHSGSGRSQSTGDAIDDLHNLLNKSRDNH